MSDWRGWLDRVNATVVEVFGRVGSASLDDDESGRLEWNALTLKTGAAELELSYETVLDYLSQGELLPLRRSERDDPQPSFEVAAEHIRRGEPGRDEGAFDFDTYIARIRRYGMGGALLVSQRSLGFFDSAWTLSSDPGVGLLHEPDDGGWTHLGHGIDIVAVDLSGEIGHDLIIKRIETARDLLLASA